MKTKWVLLVTYSTLLTLASIFFIAKRIWFQQTQQFIVPSDGWNAMQGVYASIPVDSGKRIFAGDSRVLYSPFSELYPNSICRGIGQETLFLMLKRLPSMLATHPSKIIVCSGINDIAQGRKDIERSFDTLIDQCGSKLYLMEIMPVGSASPNGTAMNHEVDSLNSFLRDRQSKGDFHLIHVFDTPLDPSFSWDGIHFNEKGYKLWQNSLHLD